MVQSAQENLPDMPDHEGPVLTLEDYYGISEDITKSLTAIKQKAASGKISFETYVQNMASENIFDNDLLE